MAKRRRRVGSMAARALKKRVQSLKDRPGMQMETYRELTHIETRLMRMLNEGKL